MPYILALDQSTSATKAVLLDATGQVIDQALREHRQIYPRSGWVEHDVHEIWRNVVAVAGEIAARQAAAVRDLACVSISNQRETFVVLDRRTGTPLHNAIVWQCRRGDAICRDMTAAGHDSLVRSRTGLKLDTYFSAPKIAYLLRERPDLSQELYSGRAVLGTIDTFLVHRLTDGAVFATDPTNASRTLLLDVHRLDWDDELCHLFGVPRPALADVRESATEFGTTDLAGQLPRRVPICGVMGDSQASLFAQRCYQPGEAKVTFGSGTSVLLNVGQEASTAGSGSVLALAWVLEGRPTYALEGLINYSSATIAWLRDQLGLIAEAAECESLATSVADNGGVFLVPAFAGLSAPHWRPDVRAAILGMTGHTHKAHIVRAALEAIAYQIKDVLDAMQQESGVTPRVVFADGGPTRNRFLMQFTADMLQRELIVADVAESSALGAALAGMMGLGIHPTLNSLAELPRETTPYRPARATREVTRLHSAWSEAVRRLL